MLPTPARRHRWWWYLRPTVKEMGGMGGGHTPAGSLRGNFFKKKQCVGWCSELRTRDAILHCYAQHLSLCHKRVAAPSNNISTSQPIGIAYVSIHQESRTQAGWKMGGLLLGSGIVWPFRPSCSVLEFWFQDVLIPKYARTQRRIEWRGAYHALATVMCWSPSALFV